MKIYMNKYRSHWLSPYKILEKVLFWEDADTIYALSKKDKPYIEKLVKILDVPCRWLMKLGDVVHPKVDYVKIDAWDTWSMDITLAQIILPMLKQLKATKHGVPGDFICDKNGEEIPFEDAERKWNNALDQMIWSFEEILKDDADEVFFTNDKFDKEGYMKYQRKVQRGLDLFGRHFRNLWT